MKKTLLTLALSFATTFSWSQSAQPQVMIEDVVDEQLVARIQSNQPGKVAAIYKSEIDGIYEIHTKEKQIFYTDANAKHFFINAQLVDFRNRLNFTKERKMLTNLVPWDSLPHSASFTVKKGTGERKLAVFTDPDCPFCAKLESDLKNLNDITISYFLLPIDSLHPNARKKAASVMCSKDKASAWDALMSKKSVDSSSPLCFTQIDEIARFAKEYRIQATPTLINGSGYILEGAPPPDRLDAFVSGK